MPKAQTERASAAAEAAKEAREEQARVTARAQAQAAGMTPDMMAVATAEREEGGKSRFFKFVGDPAANGEGPGTVTVYGYRFERGASVEIKDQFVANKLAQNNHFEETKSASSGKAKSLDEMSEAEVRAYLDERFGATAEKGQDPKELARDLETVPNTAANQGRPVNANPAGGPIPVTSALGASANERKFGDSAKADLMREDLARANSR